MTDLDELSTEELKQMLQECETKISLADKSQHSTKILLNSLYGAMGTPYFRMYDIHMAEGITLSGQATVSQSYTMFNDYLNDKLKTKNDYVIASDTDSVSGDTLIYINGERVKISDFFNSVCDNFDGSKAAVSVTGFKTLTSDGSSVLERDVKYVMAHKVKKRMYRISVSGKSVDVTEDHSVMVLEDGVLKEVKPAELTKNHILLNIITDTDRVQLCHSIK